MKLRTFTLFAAIALAFALTAATAQAAPGDGTCPSPTSTDSDGDGIPNGLDPDWVRPLDGTGFQYGYGRGVRPAGLQAENSHQWRHTWTFANLRAVAASFGFGPGTGTGVCDGTGPKGFGGFGKR